jgi:DNA-binding response OmpR family regulator
MDRPFVVIVRETPSLADSLGLLLETVGYQVGLESTVSHALARLHREGRTPIRAIVVACNRRESETLKGYPESFPSDARNLPLIVVGDRASESRRVWPSNVKFFHLPFDARELVEFLKELTGTGTVGVAAAVATEN